MRAHFLASALCATLCAAPAAFSAEEPSAPAAPGPRFEIVPVSRAQRLVEHKRVHALDTRPVSKYLAGHIEGAVHLDDETLRRPVSGLPVQYLSDAELGRIFSEAGVRADVPVLVYSDGEDPLAATMTAYALLRAGHPDVLLLDGGFEAWRGNSPVTQAHPTYTAVPWTASPDTTHSASLDTVSEMARTNEGLLLDARPAKLYRGEGKSWARNGHIPHAVSLDWKQLVQADNEALFKPRREIEALLKDAGVTPGMNTVVYCGTGREATLLYLYLRGALNRSDVTLYEGSWTEWSSDPAREVATGDAPEVFSATDGAVTVSGQPDEQMLRGLAEEGYALVVNCRTAGEMTAVDYAESALAKKLGMAYVEIPLGGNDGYEPADVAKLTETLKAHAGARALVHCASGGRATQLYIAHLATSEGLTVAEAQDRAREAGMLQPNTLERLLDTRLRSQPAGQ